MAYLCGGVLLWIRLRDGYSIVLAFSSALHQENEIQLHLKQIDSSEIIITHKKMAMKNPLGYVIG